MRDKELSELESSMLDEQSDASSDDELRESDKVRRLTAQVSSLESQRDDLKRYAMFNGEFILSLSLGACWRPGNLQARRSNDTLICSELMISY